VPSIDLTGKVAVVTGSGRGLGLAYAHALAAHGAAVVVNDVDEAVAEQAVKSITEAGGKAVAEVVAVGTSEAADRSSAPWRSSADWTSWSPTPASCATRCCGR
jgi:NAD(P)-dependent dehydrogenase (short-subunit alcohol dehydrogenase family)